MAYFFAIAQGMNELENLTLMSSRVYSELGLLHPLNGNNEQIMHGFNLYLYHQYHSLFKQNVHTENGEDKCIICTTLINSFEYFGLY